MVIILHHCTIDVELLAILYYKFDNTVKHMQPTCAVPMVVFSATPPLLSSLPPIGHLLSGTVAKGSIPLYTNRFDRISNLARRGNYQEIHRSNRRSKSLVLVTNYILN